MGEKKMMRRTGQWVLAMVCAAGLAACGGGSNDADGKAGETRPAEPPVQEQVPRQQLPIVLSDDAPEHERVLVHFIEFMRAGDVEGALLLIDPMAPGYADFDQALQIFAVAADHYDPEHGVSLSEYIRTQFTITYDTGVYELVSGGEPGSTSAQYRITFSDTEPLTLESQHGTHVLFAPGRPAAGEVNVVIHQVGEEWMLFPETDENGLIRPVPLDVVAGGPTGER